MFSSQINSRDLFFSNPVDRFLGNNGGFRTSGESGFSSSNHSQNKSSNQNRNSKDLMDSNNSYDIFSQSQKTYREEIQRDGDYQKYISQNLLFGKAKKGTTKKIFKNFDNDDSEQQDKSSITEDNNFLSEVTEIRNLLGTLTGGIRKIHSDLSVVQDSIKAVENEISIQNKRISSLDECLNNQAKAISELDKQQKKTHKKDDIIKFQELINEHSEEIKQEINRFETVIRRDSQTGKILECVKKFTAAQTNGNKKVLEDVKTCNERILKRIDTKIDKHCNEIKSLFEIHHSGKEDNMEIKLQEIKENVNALNSSIKNIIDSSKRRVQHEYKDQSLKTPAMNQLQKPRSEWGSEISNKRSICNQNSVHTPIANSLYQTEYSYKNNKTIVQNKEADDELDKLLFRDPPTPIEHRNLRSGYTQAPLKKLRLCTQNTVHTPLSKLISQSENSFSLKRINSDKSNRNIENKQSEGSMFIKPSTQNLSADYKKEKSQLNQSSTKIFRPSVHAQSTFNTPLHRSISQSEASYPLRLVRKENIMQQPSSKNYAFNIKRKASPNQSPGFAKSPTYSKFNKAIKRSQIYGNQTMPKQQNLNSQKSGKQKSFENDKSTQKSSPYLTVYEVATMAEEYMD